VRQIHSHVYHFIKHGFIILYLWYLLSSNIENIYKIES
jgi:hypothetical protein